MCVCVPECADVPVFVCGWGHLHASCLRHDPLFRRLLPAAAPSSRQSLWATLWHRSARPCPWAPCAQQPGRLLPAVAAEPGRSEQAGRAHPFWNLLMQKSTARFCSRPGGSLHTQSLAAEASISGQTDRLTGAETPWPGSRDTSPSAPRHRPRLEKGALLRDSVGVEGVQRAADCCHGECGGVSGGRGDEPTQGAWSQAQRAASTQEQLTPPRPPTHGFAPGPRTAAAVLQ